MDIQIQAGYCFLGIQILFISIQPVNAKNEDIQMNCRNCELENREGAEFCKKCGYERRLLCLSLAVSCL